MKVNKKPLSRSEKRQAKRTVRKTARDQMKRARKTKRAFNRAFPESKDLQEKVFDRKKDTIKTVKKAIIGGIKSGKVTRK